MALLPQSFNVADYAAPERDYSPLPDGWYHVKIVNAELKPTKAGNGTLLNVRMDVLGPTHAGRVLWDRYNLENPNPQAEKIGRETLSAVARAIGLSKVEDTDQLIGGEMMAKVTRRKDDDTQNEVKGYRAAEGSPAPRPAAAPAFGGAPAPAAAKAPPWVQKKQ